MNKQKFNQIVKDHQKISADDRHKLHELASSYPYSQIIHALVAKANMDAKTDISKQTLGYAAMYATDRVVLKNLIAPKQVKSKEVSKPVKKVEQEKVAAPTKSIDLTLKPKGKKITVDESIFEETKSPLSTNILADLKALKASKATYEESLETSNKKVVKEKVKATTTKKATTAKQKKSTKKAISKPKKEAKATALKEKVASKTTKTKVAKTKKSTPAKVEKKPLKTDSKKVTKASSTKKKTTTAKTKKRATKKKSENNQSEIIDNFITKEPSITSNKSNKNSENTEDLSQPSTKFTEDLMSENLAKIMVAQGKKEKAVDIYKKLIWKFPQKKAYFATQIEELKKS